MAKPAARFVGVRYDCKIVVTHRSDEETFRLVVFASREAHKHAAFNETVILPSGDEQFELEYAMAQENRPMWFHFLLFANAVDEHNVMNQTLLAWGKLSASSGGVIKLIDVKRKHQAILCVVPKGLLWSPSKQPSIKTTDATQGMIDHVRNVYKDLTHTVDSYLNWVETPMGKIPVLPFVASVSCILTDAHTDQERAEEFLLHQFDLARTNTGLTQKSWEKCSEAEKSKWLSEAVTLIPRSMIYKQDTVRVEKGRHDAADQWVRLFNFPEPNIAAFDCEDSAILCLEVLYLIQHVQFKSKTMIDVQQFCKSYTACFVFGTLRIDSDYCPHAYAAMIDSNLLDASPSSVSPGIIFEGTARLGGSWTEDVSTKATHASYSTHTALLRKLGHGKGYGRVLRNESSLEFVKQNEIYGPVYGLITGDHRGKDALHLLVHVKGSTKIGIAANDLFASKPTSVAFKVAASYSNSADSEFTQLCNELPRSHIPFVATSKNSEHSTQGDFYVAMHYETYLHREQEVQAALSEMRKSFTITSQVIHVTDQLKQQQFWFRSSTPA